MPPYTVFALDDWIKQHVPHCKITLHDSMVAPLTLKELQAFDASQEIISTEAPLKYADPRGKVGLRKNISLLYDHPNSTVKIEPDDILVTSGAISANQVVLETLVSPGDVVIAQHPTYNALIEVPRWAGATVHLWRQHEHHGAEESSFSLDVDELEVLVDQVKPKLLILNNPSNPTGALLARNQLERIVRLCASRDIIIFCDEVFRFLHHDSQSPQPPSILQLNPRNCIVTSSMSKAFALPGVRVGWIAVSPDLRSTALVKFAHSSDYKTIAVGFIDQDIAEFALRPDIRDKILQQGREICKKNIEIISTWAASNKDHVTFFRPSGAGTCVVRLQSSSGPVDDAEFVKRLVMEEKVFAPPAGLCFGDEADGSGHTDLRGFLRIGLGGKSEPLSAGLEAIARLIRRWD